ncbi:MAG: hypothetical protein HQK96_02580 [Nitrospirae bacterium]|nr:hypothetical protein [Nitrospirota bacterium]
MRDTDSIITLSIVEMPSHVVDITGTDGRFNRNTHELLLKNQLIITSANNVNYHI